MPHATFLGGGALGFTVSRPKPNDSQPQISPIDPERVHPCHGHDRGGRGWRGTPSLTEGGGATALERRVRSNLASLDALDADRHRSLDDGERMYGTTGGGGHGAALADQKRERLARARDVDAFEIDADLNEIGEDLAVLGELAIRQGDEVRR